MRFSLPLVLGALFLPAYALAASGTEGAAFLNIPVGGAPSAMGSAYSALATDAYAPVFNPGGLGFLDSTQLAGHHVSYLETSHYDFISFVHPFSRAGALGVSAQYFGTGDIVARDTSGAQVGDFNAHYGAYTFSYGHTLTPKIALGASGKWINAKIADVSANTYAADVGTLLKLSDKLQGAVVVSNAGGQLKFLNDSDALPLTVKAGAAYFFPYRITVSAEGDYHSSGLLGGHFGTQWQPVPYVSLRAGYRTDIQNELSAIAGFSTGIGLQFHGTEFAYTWMPYGDLGQTHSFALLLKFGTSKDSEHNVIKKQAYNDPDFNNLQMLLDSTDAERS